MLRGADEIDALQARAAPYKVTIGKGLHLLVMPKGSKYWRYRYRLEGKQKTLALGVYPKVALEQAIAGRDDARLILKGGGDPMAEKRNAAMQMKVNSNTSPSFQLSITNGFMNIKTKSGWATLNPEQVSALRAFLMAAHDEGCYEAE